MPLPGGIQNGMPTARGRCGPMPSPVNLNGSCYAFVAPVENDRIRLAPDRHSGLLHGLVYGGHRQRLF